jgi:hypothetical protein
MYHACPYCYALVYLDKKVPRVDNLYLSFGAAVHSACEEIIQKKIELPEKQRQLFEASFLSENCKRGFSEKSEHEAAICQLAEQGRQLLPDILPALDKYFGEYEVLAIEEPLLEKISDNLDILFKGFIDIVLRTKDGRYHILDAKTCSWGWDAEHRSDTMTTYQLVYYKYFYAKKYNIDPANISLHFLLLKRTATQDRAELFEVPCGQKKTDNAVKLMMTTIQNITKRIRIKNKLSCKSCPAKLYGTEFCK